MKKVLYIQIFSHFGIISGKGNKGYPVNNKKNKKLYIFRFTRRLSKYLDCLVRSWVNGVSFIHTIYNDTRFTSLFNFY